MRKVDVFNYIVPQRFWDEVVARGGATANLGLRLRNSPLLIDLDARFRLMDAFDGYEQVLALAAPPPEAILPSSAATDLARAANDAMHELCERHPARFPGFVASIAMNAPEAAMRETFRSVKDLHALGVQLPTNVGGRALDNPEYFPIFSACYELDVPIVLHPVRAAATPDYADEDRSHYEIWWALGLPYETSVAQARLVFSGMMDKLPGIKIVTRNMGGMMPYFSGRTGPGWQVLGARTSGLQGDIYLRILKTLKKPHAEYFKDFYADTAVFGAAEATRCGLSYYPRDRLLFASDAPLDQARPADYVRDAIRAIDELDIDTSWKEDIFWRNAAKIMNFEKRKSMAPKLARRA